MVTLVLDIAKTFLGAGVIDNGMLVGSGTTRSEERR